MQTVIKSTIVNVSKNDAAKLKNGVLERSAYAKGDGWADKN